MNFGQLFVNWDQTRSCRPGETVFAEGGTAEGLYFVLDGEVEMQRHGAVVSVEGAGGIIGESALLRSAVHNGTAVAQTEVRLARLNRAQLKELMDGNPEFALHVMARLALRLRTVDAYISARIESGGSSSGR